MPRITKIAISLPEDMLDAIERQREESGESRSEFFRRAVEMLLRYQKEKELSEQYVRAYREIPDSLEEIEAARRSAATILAGEPWE